MNEPEFSRPVAVGSLGTEPRHIAIDADQGERAALAGRFGLVDIAALAAEATLRRRDGDVIAEGWVKAAITQSCVATGEPVAATVDAPFALVFRPEPEGGRPDDEIELSEAELDIVFHEGDSIDLGEAVAETLALNLDPYPRAPGADTALREAGVKAEDEVGPIGALAGLADKLNKR